MSKLVIFTVIVLLLVISLEYSLAGYCKDDYDCYEICQKKVSSGGWWRKTYKMVTYTCKKTCSRDVCCKGYIGDDCSTKVICKESSLCNKRCGSTGWWFRKRAKYCTAVCYKDVCCAGWTGDDCLTPAADDSQVFPPSR